MTAHFILLCEQITKYEYSKVSILSYCYFFNMPYQVFMFKFSLTYYLFSHGFPFYNTYTKILSLLPLVC